jgi:hypothetical protein
VRRALVVSALLSVVVHYIIAPWRLLPSSTGIEFKDVDAELTIPTDLLGEEAPPPPPAPLTAPAPPVVPVQGPGADAGPKPLIKDASVDVAPAQPDGSMLMVMDAALGAFDGEAPVVDADAEAPDAGWDAAPEAGGPVGSPVAGGLSSLVQGGTVYVDLLLNVDVIRAHPVGSRVGPLFTATPQWADFLQGGKGGFDPLQHLHWIHIYGPSLIHTEKDAVHIHHSAPEMLVDNSLDGLAARTDKGGAFDAGVPNVKAVLGFADNAQRVFMRVRPGEVVIVPPAKAAEFAKILSKRSVVPQLRPNEGLRLRVREPYKQISIPQLKFPQTLKELRLWVVARADGGADVFGEGDCDDEAAAEEVRAGLQTLLDDQKKSALVRTFTRGLLNTVVLETNGSKVVLRAPATQEQIEAIMGAIAFRLGVQLPVAPGGKPE